MASSKRPSFLTFNGKKYHPSLEWNEEEGLLQDPKTHAPNSKKDFKVSSFFGFFVGKFVNFMFCWELDVEIFVILLLFALVEIVDIVRFGWKFL